MKTLTRTPAGDPTSMDRTLEFLKELVDAHGVPGFEADVAHVMQKHLKGVGEISRDRLGSFICEKVGES
jgi:putative aminopeptidase FrvX